MSGETSGEKHNGSTNLRPPWKPGQSGNPKGRPPAGQAVADMVRKVLEEKHEGNISKADAILQTAARLAIEGSKQHMDFLFERAFGKVKDVIETLVPTADDETAAWIDFIRKDETVRKAYLAYLKEHEQS